MLIDSKYICDKYNIEHVPVQEGSFVGIAKSVQEGLIPIHGLRHPVEGIMNGWYIWAGDFSNEHDFFKPLHTYHLEDINPIIIKYLGLPPGWRFLITSDGYEDVWYDETLLKI